jgi:hypothetical protein
MKKVLLISMLIVSTVSFAQQSSWYIGGQAGINSSTTKDASTGIKSVTSGWNFSPEFGTFLKDDIQLGVALGISGSKEKVDGNDVIKSTSFNPTVYGRKFFKITDNFSAFGGLYLNLISRKTKDYSGTSETKGSGFGFSLGAGIAYALSPRFTAVGQYGVLGYSTVKNKVDGIKMNTDTDFGFGVNTVGGSVFNVGLYYTIKQ